MIVSADQEVGVSELGMPGPARLSGRQLRELLADDGWLDELIDRAEQGGVRLTGEGGFLPEMVKAVLERGLAAERSGLRPTVEKNRLHSCEIFENEHSIPFSAYGNP